MLCEREKSTVPRFVRLCTEAVEKRGTHTANTQPAPANVMLNLEGDARGNTPLFSFEHSSHKSICAPYSSAPWHKSLSKHLLTFLWLPDRDERRTETKFWQLPTEDRDIIRDNGVVWELCGNSTFKLIFHTHQNNFILSIVFKNLVIMNRIFSRSTFGHLYSRMWRNVRKCLLHLPSVLQYNINLNWTRRKSEYVTF